MLGATGLYEMRLDAVYYLLFSFNEEIVPNNTIYEPVPSASPSTPLQNDSDSFSERSRSKSRYDAFCYRTWFAITNQAVV